MFLKKCLKSLKNYFYFRPQSEIFQDGRSRHFTVQCVEMNSRRVTRIKEIPRQNIFAMNRKETLDKVN